jgi:hypothetical protein
MKSQRLMQLNTAHPVLRTLKPALHLALQPCHADRCRRLLCAVHAAVHRLHCLSVAGLQDYDLRWCCCCCGGWLPVQRMEAPYSGSMRAGGMHRCVGCQRQVHDTYCLPVLVSTACDVITINCDAVKHSARCGCSLTCYVGSGILLVQLM